ncbi:tumor necrosis factor receptor superfamily member 1B isoform X2 [Denticeps clupeoides]|uniref:tumor necrosis factor receptor superfamily member 1B isoform X2 n=1 Tax=Denticeps clupeoides TaxID=299321 RepID=UPI0010A4CF3C|nr:tumor necrosis factor receptor superfamily member 1B-like isoform X2 [Denticeps clupeoides]
MVKCRMVVAVRCLISFTFVLFVKGLHSLPYKPDGKCKDTLTEYFFKGLCCKKCQPGFRRQAFCNAESDTVCEPCPVAETAEAYNYADKCISCRKCKKDKGLVPAQECNRSVNARCKCQDDMYCMRTEQSSCSECRRMKSCPPGSGVNKPGTENSDVTCQECPTGTFSGEDSSKDTCQPHTHCDPQDILQAGNSTSDTVCKSVKSTTSESTQASSPGSSTTTQWHVSTQSSQPTGSSRGPLPEEGWTAVIVAVSAIVLAVMIVLALLVIFLLKKQNGLCEKIPKTTDGDEKDAVSVQCIRQDQELLLCEKGHSEESTCTGDSCDVTRHKAQNCSGNDAHINDLQPTSPQVSVSFTATINVNAATVSSPVTLSPSTQPSQPDFHLPLSQEEELHVPFVLEDGKEAHAAIQETGKTVC